MNIELPTIPCKLKFFLSSSFSKMLIIYSVFVKEIFTSTKKFYVVLCLLYYAVTISDRLQSMMRVRQVCTVGGRGMLNNLRTRRNECGIFLVTRSGG